MKQSAKRRRTKVEIDEEKIRETQLQAEIDRKLSFINQWEEEKRNMQAQLADAENFRQQMAHYVDEG